MQTIVIDAVSVCQSVRPSASLYVCHIERAVRAGSFDVALPNYFGLLL